MGVTTFRGFEHLGLQALAGSGVGPARVPLCSKLAQPPGALSGVQKDCLGLVGDLLTRCLLRRSSSRSSWTECRLATLVSRRMAAVSPAPFCQPLLVIVPKGVDHTVDSLRALCSGRGPPVVRSGVEGSCCTASASPVLISWLEGVRLAPYPSRYACLH